MADQTRTFHDGREDGLEPLVPLDLDEVDTFPDLLEAMGHTSFGGRQLGHAYEVLLEMARDPDCMVVGTFSGAMTIAKMGLVVCKMIDEGLLDMVVTTGALMAHGLTESVGLVHYKTDPGTNDPDLYAKGYNRVYDTIEMEANLTQVEKVIIQTMDRMGAERELSSELFCRAVGAVLDEMDAGPGILRSAYRKGVPVYIPAFTDSEIGLDVATWAIRRFHAQKKDGGMTPEDAFDVLPRFNPFLDLNSYTLRVTRAKRLGIFTIGGGVPRNWAQQVSPYLDMLSHHLDLGWPRQRFRYGVRICPEPVHWGGLSGCTYSEGVSWGKFMTVEEGGRFAEVPADATLVWPLLVKAVLDKLKSERGRTP